VQERLAIIPKIFESPPMVHVRGTHVWRTHLSCYEFLARHVEPGARTLETGCGVSTVLFTAWGCEHLCVVPEASQRDGIYKYCEERNIDASRLSFDVRPSEEALPRLDPPSEFDLFFIDGNHGFPAPIIDWFYGASHLRSGGILVIDDVNLPQVSLLPDWYLSRDPRWEHLESTVKWAAYLRHSKGSLSELQGRQPFITPKSQNPYVAKVRSAAAMGVRRLSAAAKSRDKK
jgi:hypothetical protein